MFDPLAAAHTQENGQTLENLVRLNAEDDQGYGQLPDEGGQERKGHDDRIDADGVKEQGEFGISAPAQDAVADGHLVGHADHDKAHDHHDLIRQPQGVGRQAVVGQQGLVQDGLAIAVILCVHSHGEEVDPLLEVYVPFRQWAVGAGNPVQNKGGNGDVFISKQDE